MDNSATTSATKRCRHCDQELPVTQFTRDRNRPDGLDPYCRSCSAAKYEARAVAHRAAQARYRAENPGVVRRRKATYYAANRARIRSGEDLRRFGVEDRDAFAVQRGSACQICGTDRPGGKYNRWAIDHDRACCPGRRSCGRCVRGILCHRCNPGIGLLDDDPNRLHEAATYILKRRDVLGELLARI